MRNPYNGPLATGGISPATRAIRDRAELLGWRLFRGGGYEPWGLRCLADNSKVRRAVNLSELTVHLQVLTSIHRHARIANQQERK